MNRKVLYISYDGMTDPLGQSQVLPYLAGLSAHGYQFTILSFEKRKRYRSLRKLIEEKCAQANIEWVPLRFTSNPPLVSKLYDAIRMRWKAYALHRKNKFDMIHCRSYLAAAIGLQLKRKKGAKFFFDMRGFWADEKKDAGTWNQDSFLFRKVYQHYKKKEAEFIREADCIVSLTEAGKAEIKKWTSYNAAVPIVVIPCCSDMDHFTLTSPQDKITGRRKLGLPEENLILSYLGSVGAWYMLDEMIELFKRIKKKYSNAMFLFITPSDPVFIRSKMTAHGISPDDVFITEASRLQVPEFIKASDINVSFIKPVYSKISSSPTKLGEVLVTGIPVIVNTGVGDVEAIIDKTRSGVVLQDFNEAEYNRVVESIPGLLQLRPAEIRERAAEIFSLTIGVSAYKRSYDQVLETKS